MTSLKDIATKLPAEAYLSNDVCALSRFFIGKLLVTNFDSHLTAGRIVETEAYNGIADRASHAYAGKLTKRTKTMYEKGGVAYVYLCYGIHHLFNIIIGSEKEPLAVLIRAIEPVFGEEIMLERSSLKSNSISQIGAGPGKLSRALGISTLHNGLSLMSDHIWLADDGFKSAKDMVIACPRIGVDYAGEDALLPYRFCLKTSKSLSVAVPNKYLIDS